MRKPHRIRFFRASATAFTFIVEPGGVEPPSRGLPTFSPKCIDYFRQRSTIPVTTEQPRESHNSSHLYTKHKVNQIRFFDPIRFS